MRMPAPRATTSPASARPMPTNDLWRLVHPLSFGPTTTATSVASVTPQAATARPRSKRPAKSSSSPALGRPPVVRADTPITLLPLEPNGVWSECDGDGVAWFADFFGLGDGEGDGDALTGVGEAAAGGLFAGGGWAGGGWAGGEEPPRRDCMV